MADTLENMFLGQGVLLQQLNQQGVRNHSSESFAEHTHRLKTTLCNLGTGRNSSTPTEPPTTRSLAKRKRVDETWPSTKRNDLYSFRRNNRELGQSLDSLVSETQLETILETYFKLIHPWIPVVHPSTFLRRAREIPKSPSLVLILHAIIAVAVPCADGQELSDLKHHVTDFRHNVITTAMDDGSLEAIQALLIIAFDTVSGHLYLRP